MAGTTYCSSEKVDVAELEAAQIRQSGSDGDAQSPGIDGLPNDGGRSQFAHLDEKKILRKMDLRLIPMLALLYLLSFMDRANIGNAKIEGLQEDLNLTDNQYHLCLTVFFFTYAAVEVPSNLLLKKLRPSVWLPSIMVAWGTCMTLMGTVQNYHGLLVTRLFLGLTEAGLFPGVTYYLTMWYCRREIQLRTALFFSAASIAGAFSGLLAYAIAKMDGVGGYAGWRWIFILEGLLTIVVAFFAYWALYDFPETATFLTKEERQFVAWRLKYQGQSSGANEYSQTPQAEEFKWRYVKQAFTDIQIIGHILLFWGVVCPLYGVSLFLPSIIRDLGHSKESAQLMTIPIYITAAILAIIVAYASDKVGKRSPFILSLMCLMIVGFIMCIVATDPKVIYAGVFIATCGIYPSFPGVVTFLSNNLSGSYKRSVGMALHIGIGNLAGAMASNFYRAQDAPHYHLGHGLELGFIVLGMISTITIIISYRFANSNREKRIREGQEPDVSIEELSAQGDRAVTWRYMF